MGDFCFVKTVACIYDMYDIQVIVYMPACASICAWKKLTERASYTYPLGV